MEISIFCNIGFEISAMKRQYCTINGFTLEILAMTWPISMDNFLPMSMPYCQNVNSTIMLLILSRFDDIKPRYSQYRQYYTSIVFLPERIACLIYFLKNKTTFERW